MVSVQQNPHVEFRNVEKSFDGTSLVVRNLNLVIGRGEFLTLLGPSGSGKTTTLLMLAGFEPPTAGEIFVSGRPVSRLPPHRRNIGMVFQNYALFPHMTVRENLAFPLQVRRMARPEIEDRVRRALEMVELPKMQDRRPAQLSGGQQQRVAVARALVFDPELVLMDEPLGALDKQLREQMQYEIKRIHDRVGVTFVYVTHDQAEALTMSASSSSSRRRMPSMNGPPTASSRSSSARTIACGAGSARSTAITAGSSLPAASRSPLLPANHRRSTRRPCCRCGPSGC
jgi:putative spermidine/putrescine transport system ATP-binding protein